VDLVDEQDDVAPALDLFEDLLQALLEVTAIAGTGDQGAQVEGVQVLALEILRHFFGNDPLGEALDNGGLAHPGLSDEDGVVLGAAGKDLHDPLYLAGAADDRVERPLSGRLGEIAAELVEHGRPRGARLPAAGSGGFGLLLLAASGAGKELDDRLANLLQLGSQLLEDLGGDTFSLPDQPEEDVLGADVVVAELERFAQGELEHLLGPGRERDVPRRRLLALSDDLDHLVTHRGKVDVETLECLGGDALTFVEKTEEDVLGADVIVV
jgi:hypothetical protein